MGSSGWKLRLDAKIIMLATQVYVVIFSAAFAAASSDTDPCDNFYKYACENPAKDQGYISLDQKAKLNVADNLINVFKQLNSQSDLELFKKWQLFQTSCKNTGSINAQGITPLSSVLNNFGGWPLSNLPSADNPPKLQDILSFYGKLNVFPLFEIVSHADQFHKENKITIRQPQTIFLEGIETASQSDVSRYSNFIKRIIEAIVFSNQAKISQETLTEVTSQIIDFETKLSKILSPSQELSFYKPTILKDFQSKINQDVVNWKNIINGLSSAELVSDEDKIDVSTESYYPKLVKLLQETSASTVLNYVHWRFVIQYLPYTSDDLRSLYFENADLLQNPEEENLRTDSCTVEPVLDSIVSYQYAKEYITPDIESSVHQILNDIKQATIDIVKESSLLNEDEKRAVEKKVSTMKFVFGVSGKAKNLEALSEFYDSWTVGENYFDNILALRRFTTTKELGKIKKSETENNFETDFMRVTKYYGYNYEALDNTVYIKPENLVSPLFSSDAPNVQKYGLLGFTIAKGITMAFIEADSIESYVDGRFKKLYSDETQEAYWNRSDCFSNQFAGDSNISEDSESNVEPAMYNMADTTAIQIAYKAFQSKHTSEATSENTKEFFSLFVKFLCQPEQQEFSGEWSHRLTLPEYRVVGSLRNVRQFAEAYACPRGARMNPETVCSFFI